MCILIICHIWRKEVDGLLQKQQTEVVSLEEQMESQQTQMESQQIQIESQQTQIESQQTQMESQQKQIENLLKLIQAKVGGGEVEDWTWIKLSTDESLDSNIFLW